MRALMFLVLTLLLPSVWAGTTTGDATPAACGEDVPPSGLYYEPVASRLYEHDCATGLLVPSLIGPGGSICGRDLDPTTGAGICAEVTRTDTDRYAWHFQVALVSLHDQHARGTIFDEATQELLVECSDATDGCRPVRRGLVHWLDVRGEATLECGSETRDLRARIEVVSADGIIALQGARATLC